MSKLFKIKTEIISIQICVPEHALEKNFQIGLLPDKIILHVGTDNVPHIKADEMLEELGKLKSLIWEMLPSVKIILSAPTIRVDIHNANENNIDFIKLLETNDSLLIKHPNIKENHLDRYGLHLNHDGTRVLAKNLRLCTQKY